uniref:Glutaredoxin-1 n=1 Tax=Equus asinus TaxID=9793 RepID=A0A9L0J5L6_EQUAS
MAKEFVNSKLQPGKVVVFIKPTCPYCKKTHELLSRLPFKQGSLEFVDITATGDDASKIQDYLQELTGARTASSSLGSEASGGMPSQPDRLHQFWCWVGMFLVSRERSFLLLTTQVTHLVLVSSLPVSLCVTPLAWRLSGPQ